MIVAGIAILLIAGFGAIAVLLGCLRGFSLSRKHRKTCGLLLRVEDAGGGRPVSWLREPLPFPHSPRPIPHTTPAGHGISKNTATFAGMAVLLGSRTAAFDRQSRTLLMPCRDSKAGGANNFNARGT